MPYQSSSDVQIENISGGALYEISYPLSLIFFQIYPLSLIIVYPLSLIFSIYPLSLTFFNLSLIPYNYFYPLSLIFSHFYPLSLIIFHFYPLSLMAAAPLSEVMFTSDSTFFFKIHHYNEDD